MTQHHRALWTARGPYEVAPAKTRIAFMGRVRFASVNSVSDRGMNVHFGLPRRLRSRRIRKIEEPARGWYVHHVRVTSVDELDDLLLSWLRESYHQMGMQERLAGRRNALPEGPKPRPRRGRSYSQR